jgi:hypothetical protein
MTGNNMFGFISDEFIENTENRSSFPNIDKYLLTIDGVLVEKEVGYVFNDLGRIEAYLDSTEFHDRLILLSPKELLKDFSEFSFKSIDAWEKMWNHGNEAIFIDYFLLSYYHNDDKLIVKCICKLDFAINEWKQLWSLREYAEQLELVVRSESISDAYWHGLSPEFKDFLNSLAIEFHIENIDCSIYSELKRILSILSEIQREILLCLTQKLQPNSILRYFNFPDEVKIACEQYLLYFIQFLHDIGIEAKGEITEKANGVLFSITPNNQEEALEKISEVLDMYLCLPSKPNLNLSMPLGESIEVQRLSATLLNFQSQLMLANATIKLQQSTIEEKELIIDQKNELIQQQQSFSGQILIQSAQKNQTKQEEKESLIDGMVSVKKYNAFNFLELDLPNMVRAFKNMVRKRN